MLEITVTSIVPYRGIASLGFLQSRETRSLCSRKMPKHVSACPFRLSALLGWCPSLTVNILAKFVLFEVAVRSDGG